ncbi:MAG: tetratricopeptide repeat protein [candidate division WOR-3 bacterium]|nr:tetratricopeptide repeat protein [candidate division WOR-3 bacterium]
MKFFWCTALIAVSVAWSDVGSDMRRGNYLERKGEYDAALESYQKALVQEPDNPKIHYNIGRVLYRMEKYDEAVSEFQLGFLDKERMFQSNVFYNIGNSQFKKGQLEVSIDAYKMSLLANPEDLQAKQNLEFCLRIKEKLQNQPQSDSTQQQHPPDEQPQPQPDESEIGKEQAERVLQAMENKERENLEKSRVQERKESVEKDW